MTQEAAVPTRHTPTPWMTFVEDRRTFIGTEQPGTTPPLLVAEIWNPADAPLLLAAPEMADLLRRLVGEWDAGVDTDGAFVALQEAVAAARALLSTLDQEAEA